MSLNKFKVSLTGTCFRRSSTSYLLVSPELRLMSNRAPQQQDQKLHHGRNSPAHTPNKDIRQVSMSPQDLWPEHPDAALVCSQCSPGLGWLGDSLETLIGQAPVNSLTPSGMSVSPFPSQALYSFLLCCGKALNYRTTRYSFESPWGGYCCHC